MRRHGFSTLPYFPTFGVVELASLVVDIFQTGLWVGVSTSTVCPGFKGTKLLVTHCSSRNRPTLNRNRRPLGYRIWVTS